MERCFLFALRMYAFFFSLSTLSAFLSLYSNIFARSRIKNVDDSDDEWWYYNIVKFKWRWPNVKYVSIVRSRVQYKWKCLYDWPDLIIIITSYSAQNRRYIMHKYLYTFSLLLWWFVLTWTTRKTLPLPKRINQNSKVKM